jgi:6-phosphogluconolactonase
MQQRIWSLGRLAMSLSSVTLATGAGLAAMTVFPVGAAAAEEASVPPERLYRVPESLADRLAGTVFTMTNGTDPALGNQVVAFHRLDDGTLSVAGFFPTEDFGSGPAPTSTVFGVPVPANADGLGSQGGLLLSEPRDDGARLLFAVNAGSDSISCFRVEADDSGAILSPPTRAFSGGLFPVSLALRPNSGQNVLYVLNSGGNGNVTGFKVSEDCDLDPIGGGRRSLTGLIDDPPFNDPEPNEVLTTAADIGFTPDGSKLIVAIKGGPDGQGGGFEGGIVVFGVRNSGALRSAAPAVTEFSGEDLTAGPFSFEFDDNGVMVLNHANSFTVASFHVEDSGALTPLDGPLPISNLQDGSVLAFGGFNCWIVIHNGIAYIMTFGDIPATSGGLPDGPGVISAVTIGANGSLELLDAGPDAPAPGVVAVLPQDDRVVGNHGIDLTVVEDGDRAFLYAVEPRIGEIGAWEINDDGTLTPLGNVNGGLTPGVDPFAGTNPGINDFLERCYLQQEPRSPECAQGSAQGIVGF